MQKKECLKKQKGSIALFVLLSILFFLVIVTGVGISFRNKESNIDSQFAKIKNSYEKDVENEELVYNNKSHDRSWINVGDYVKYVPPKNNGAVKSYPLIAGASGYDSDQTIPQQYNIWRVLNKNPDGTIDIMPAFKDTGVTYTDIFFRDAKGWNNAPYLLDAISSYLYANESNGIKARSIDYEDITSHMIEGVEGATVNDSGTGKGKISTYQKRQVGNLSPGTYIDSISGTTVTYKTRTSYPTLYFNVKDNESNPYYTSSTIDTSTSTNGRIAAADKPATLTVKYTNYYETIASTDFENNKAYSVIFETGTRYWLASRCVGCDSYRVAFGLRYVSNSILSGYHVFYSDDDSDSRYVRISPVVTLGSNVKILQIDEDNDLSHPYVVDTEESRS